ncbi:hypothetical protein GCM10010404_51560 [Nonomuraea africana]|uniref:Pimeloyl-ACP methyl ester carboxylesterase n=1 Tax=Nonomuraea africana TaxID=46171 RepID=A0ABR9KGP6_9ACTN|nr:hypothetical protein [Nonomuraea africana]MBE1561000.1 pimeloyl-ACP methyl ester carboxylesterase [Nonomuraea africana]
MTVTTQGRRAASRLGGRHVEIPDSRMLIPLDNPAALSAQLRRFITSTGTGRI